ncbi:MAG TPA: serine/threonine-protein kinase [Gemmataceae bacterium]|nr:serine/threonine-protein kinase [Gemmataceae bacterium]
MSITSVPELVRVLRAGSLLSNGQVDVLARELLPRFTEPRALARELVRRSWVTPYQINQLFLGREQDLVLGPYVLMERLGEGGMGQVFKARHRKLNRVVALKIIRRDKLANPEAIRRFFREVQAGGALSHPNIVAAYDAGEVSGTYFLAMEYVDGSDLGKLVKQGGPLAVPQACDYVRQVAFGLQHAFEKGLVHRDIKPSNLVVQGTGSHAESGPVVKILDMGLARVNAGEGADGGGTLTQAHAVLGTPDFIAPEQARNARDADTRSDLYSLGCTFHFILTGQVPFPAEAPMEKLLKHYLEEPARVEALRPEVPPAVGRVVRKLMAKAPGQRYQTPAELAGVLESLLAVGVHASAAVPLAIPVGPAPAEQPPPPSLPDEGMHGDDTVPDVGLEFETSDSIIQNGRAKNGERRPRRRNLSSYALAGLAVGLTAVLLLVLFRYLLH